jgi:uncharacterized membrane protein
VKQESLFLKMPLSDPFYILGVLCLIIALSEWLSHKRGFKFLGTAFIVIILAALVSNAGIIPPPAKAPVYDGILTYVAPMAIFLLMLEVRLKSLKKAGIPALTMYLTGSAGSIAGVVAGFYLLRPDKMLGDNAYALAGMFTGTYVGGSINFNAVALHYGISKEGNLFAASTAADNICTALWIIACITLPRILGKLYPRIRTGNGQMTAEEAALLQRQSSDEATLNPLHLSMLAGMGFLALFAAKAISKVFPEVPYILTFTSIALLLAQIPFVQRLRGARVLGLAVVYLFLAVIGVFCNIPALVADGEVALMMLAWITIIILIHGAILYAAGAIFRVDWDIIAIASQANIGGPTTALSNARTLDRNDLQLPAVLIGTLGYAIGTYLGIFVAETLAAL